MALQTAATAKSGSDGNKPTVDITSKIFDTIISVLN